jgi:hypothetical protein
MRILPADTVAAIKETRARFEAITGLTGGAYETAAQALEDYAELAQQYNEVVTAYNATLDAAIAQVEAARTEHEGDTYDRWASALEEMRADTIALNDLSISEPYFIAQGEFALPQSLDEVGG